jgi:hypothetical protein
MVTLQQLPSYFFPFFLVCDNALAATDLVLLLVRPSRSNDDALLATRREVCFMLDFGMT